MADGTEIIIREAAGGMVEAVIRPLPSYTPRDREPFRSYRAAKRYADCEAIAHPSWRVVDQVPLAHRKEAA